MKTLILDITDQQFEYLERLKVTGVFGESPEQVAALLMLHGVRAAIKDGWMPKLENDTRAKCPGCGSPNLTDFDSMGDQKEFHCRDCGQNFSQ